jgi:4a-hydroxytetrahydrobiopterin dehydratase
MNYSANNIQDKINELKDWEFKNNGLDKAFKFKNFTEAMAFLVQVAFIAEKQNHHPEIWNVYNKVTLRLTTHDEDGVTDKDFKLAAAIDGLN